MGPPSYMRSVVDRNVVMRRIPVLNSGSEAVGWDMVCSRLYLMRNWGFLVGRYWTAWHVVLCKNITLTRLVIRQQKLAERGVFPTEPPCSNEDRRGLEEALILCIMFYVPQAREVSSESFVFFNSSCCAYSVRSSGSGHSIKEIRLVRNIGKISKTVIGLVISVVCTAVNNEEVLSVCCPAR